MPRGDPQRIPVEALLKDYLAHLRRRGDSDKAAADVRQGVRRFLKGAELGTVGQVTGKALEAQLDGLQEAGLAGRMVSRHRGHVRGLFAWACAEKWIPHDPVRGVRPRDQTLKKRKLLGPIREAARGLGLRSLAVRRAACRLCILESGSRE